MEVPRFTAAELNTGQPIEEWLAHENNRLLPEAASFYRSWLDITGNTAWVEKPLAEWLAANRSAEDIDGVFRAWLRAGGRFRLIRKEVFEWVRTHTLGRNAVYVLKYVAKQRVLPDDVTLKVLNWCADFADDPDAIWRLTFLSAHISADLFLEAVRASPAVLDPLFANPNLDGLTRSHVTTVLGNLAKLEHLASHPASPEVDALLCRWMNHPQSFEASPRHAPYHQTRQFLARLLAAAESEASTPDLWPLIDWVTSWDERSRLECKDLIKRVRHLRHTSTGGRPRRR
jgi:hypothetical protein